MSRRKQMLWHWGTEKDLRTPQEQRALDDLTPPRAGRPGGQRQRKDTRRWCRGVEGREHTLTIDFPPSRLWVWNRCRPSEKWLNMPWSCSHVELCTTCGRITREGWQLNYVRECPTYCEQHAGKA